jgi:SagB-type dehydrogenase family enzyme
MTPDFGNGVRQQAELWSLREDVRIEPDPGGTSIRLSGTWGSVTIQRPAEVVREALRRMLLGPISLENAVRTGDDPSGGQAAGSLALLHRVLDRLQPFVIRTLQIASGQPLLSVVPLTPRSRFLPKPLPAQMQVRLSAFAQIRTDGNEYRLESPLSLHRVLLHRPEAVGLLGSLGRPVAVAATSRTWPQLDSAAGVLSYLAATGMVVGTDDTEDPPGITEAADLAGWSLADLTFHTCSNTGRHDHEIGRTYPMGHDGSPDPVVKSRGPELGIPLHRPTWERLATADPPLAVVMEGRRSMRTYGTEPVTAEELGDLLYRVARVRSVIVPLSVACEPGDYDPDPRLSDRPYPAGGACYELELYITVGSCAGIPTGVYHYDPLEHRLEPVDAPSEAIDDLLRGASQAAAMEVPPPVLITMTARYRRLSWKYEGIAYATVLKDVGVMLQNLYLVSTAMRLAPCALGAVNLEATARAFGTDWQLEPSVGQFILGRAPETPPQYRWRWEPVNDPQWADRAWARLRG